MTTPPFNKEGTFQDHCVANTPPPAPRTVSIQMCFFPFWKHGRNVFCDLCLFFFFIFCLGLLISATNSVSADLGKPMANLKTTLVRIPLRIEQLKEPKHYPCLLSFSEEENPLIRRAQLMLNENSQLWEAW